MARNNVQNSSEKQGGLRSELMFIEKEPKFCSRILDVSFSQASRFEMGVLHPSKNDSSWRFYLRWVLLINL